jgi:hypothetical protein
MKQILLIIVILMSFAVFGTAQTASPTPTQNQPSTEDIKQAKENLKVLLSDTKETSTKDEHKNIADVMDKGIDVLTGYVGTLEGLVSKYAPEVWRIMIKQQYAKAIAYPLFWGLMLFVPFGVNRIARAGFGVPKDMSLAAWDDKQDYEGFMLAFVGIIPTVIGAIFAIIFLYNLTAGIMIAINPEYYALKDIIQMLR